MTSESFTLEYQVNTDRFIARGAVNREGRYEIVGNFLRQNLGPCIDRREPIEREKYTLVLTWHVETDGVECTDDTGNIDLRDGILLLYLETSAQPEADQEDGPDDSCGTATDEVALQQLVRHYRH